MVDIENIKDMNELVQKIQWVNITKKNLEESEMKIVHELKRWIEMRSGYREILKIYTDNKPGDYIKIQVMNENGGKEHLEEHIALCNTTIESIKVLFYENRHHSKIMKNLDRLLDKKTKDLLSGN